MSRHVHEPDARAVRPCTHPCALQRSLRGLDVSQVLLRQFLYRAYVARERQRGHCVLTLRLGISPYTPVIVAVAIETNALRGQHRLRVQRLIGLRYNLADVLHGLPAKCRDVRYINLLARDNGSRRMLPPITY